MMKINSRKMSFDLTVLGFIRNGHVFCPTCGSQTAGLEKALQKRQADKLYSEGNGHACDVCGTILKHEEVEA